MTGYERAGHLVTPGAQLVSVMTSVTDMVSSLLVELGDDLSPEEIDGELPPDEVGKAGPDGTGAVPLVVVEATVELLLME